jgi:hypothetical protein
MTINKAIDIIKCLAWHTRPSEEDVEQAIKALEQQPCEDAISRKEALKTINKMDIPEDMSVFEIKSHIGVEIGTLPPVQPKPKTGHWIIPKGDVKPFGDDTIQCDMCGFFTDVDCNYNFCPNCGAKMVKPQESEET